MSGQAGIPTAEESLNFWPNIEDRAMDTSAWQDELEPLPRTQTPRVVPRVWRSPLESEEGPSPRSRASRTYKGWSGWEDKLTGEPIGEPTAEPTGELPSEADRLRRFRDVLAVVDPLAAPRASMQAQPMVQPQPQNQPQTQDSTGDSTADRLLALRKALDLSPQLATSSWLTQSGQGMQAQPMLLPEHHPQSQPQTPTLRNEDEASGFSQQSGFGSTWPNGPLAQTPRRMMNNLDMVRHQNMELNRLHAIEAELNTGDTLVIVNIPDVLEKKKPRDCYNTPYKSRRFRVHSAKLIATGSNKFAEMLGPSYQYRILRRHKLVNKLPDSVVYVLDLTPPSEGDELVCQMMELSLTPGIIKWWSASIRHGVDPLLVEGHDDVCNCRPFVVPIEEAEAAAQGDAGRTKPPKMPNQVQFQQMKIEGRNKVVDTPSYRAIEDYCPVRHCNSIIRLLMIIEGIGMTFHSASRVWTLVSLAKIYDCASVLRDPVAQWLMHGTNTRFIEVLPEEALQLGFTLQLPQVTQCAFRILVNELALREAAAPEVYEAHRRRSTTIFGRKTGNLDDELSNLIQHSARAFTERMATDLRKLTSPDILDTLNSAEWQHLREIERLLEQETTGSTIAVRACLSMLMKALTYALNHSFENLVYDKTTMNPYKTQTQSVDDDRITYVEPSDFEMTPWIIKDFTPLQRMLIPFIYSDFQDRLNEAIYVDRYSFHPDCRNVKFAELVTRLEDQLESLTRDAGNTRVGRTDEWAEAFTAPNFRIKRPLIDLRRLEEEVWRGLRPIHTSWVRYHIEPSMNITRHLLLTLNQNELKYLPLWAGGTNDGTGGVFESYLPPTDMGPNGPGPSYHTGHTIPSASSTTGSLMAEISQMKIIGSTTAGSVDVHDSISTVYRPDHVIADDKSIASESFQSENSAYQDAEFQVPAEHQGRGQAVGDLVEESDSGDDSDNTIMYEDDDLHDFTTDDDDDAADGSVVSMDDVRSEDSMVLL